MSVAEVDTLSSDTGQIEQNNSQRMEEVPEPVEEDMEEGELPEEGELTDDDTPQIVTADVAVVKDSRKSADIEDFVRQKQKELNQKIEDQLVLAGVKPTVIETEKTNSKCVLPDSMEKKKRGPKYRDLDPKPKLGADPTETMINAWLTGKKKAKQSDNSTFDPNEEYYGYGTGGDPNGELGELVDKEEDKDYRRPADTDYRWPRFGSDDERFSRSPEGQSNQFGDRDYRDRKERRRRRSSGEDSLDEGRHSRGSPRRKRRRSPSPPRRRPSRWNERTSICKFFREGYCRDGDNCTYSHDANDSGRKGASLCKYYQQGYCKKSVQCPFLHGEFPCKAFYKGECSKDLCPYSHQLLNDFTQPIYDQMLRDEELASKITIPQGPTKRKVLLAGPPAPMQLPNAPTSYPNPPFQMPAMSPVRGDLPPPGLSINNIQSQETFLYYDKGQNTNEKQYLPMAPPIPPPSMNFPIAPPPLGPNSSFPPPFPNPYVPLQSGDSAQQPLPAHAAQEPLHEKNDNANPPNSGAPSFNINEMLRKIKAQVHGEEEPEESPASPPMFSAVESSTEPPKIPQLGVPFYRLVIVDVTPRPVDPDLLQRSLKDTKLRNDPRIKKLLDSQFNEVSNIISSKTAPDPKEKEDPKTPSDPRTARDPRLKKSQPPSDSPPKESPSDTTMQQMINLQLQMTAAMQAQMGIPPVMPQLPLPGPPPVSLNPPIPPPGMAAPMAGPMMPVMGTPAPPVTSSGGSWMPNFSSMDLSLGTFSNGPDAMPEPFVNNGTTTENGPNSSRDPRVRQSRWNEGSSPNDSTEGSPGQDQDKPVTLREKRADLQYESPLNRGAGGSEASKYNQMPNVRIKKKSSPLLE